MKVLRTWRKICIERKSWLREITLSQDHRGLWIGFTECSAEGPDETVLLPLSQIVPMADALDTVAVRDDRTHLSVRCQIEGMDAWQRPARFEGATYMLANFRYRPGITFSGRDGLRTIWFVSGRQANLIARLLRQIHAREQKA